MSITDIHLEKGKLLTLYQLYIDILIVIRALVPRDPIFAMYTQMTVRNYMRYIHLNLMFIGGH